MCKESYIMNIVLHVREVTYKGWIYLGIIEVWELIRISHS
jgi:hypothetical protein